MADNLSTLDADGELELLRRTIASAGLLPLIEAPHEEPGLESAEDFVARMQANDARKFAGLLSLIEAPRKEPGLESAEDFVARMQANDAQQLAIGRTRRLRYTSLAGSVLVAAATLVVFVVQPWQQPVAAADTPAVLDYELAAATSIAYASGEDPRAELLALSQAAAEQVPEPTQGRVQHVVTDNWFANFDHKSATAAVIPQINEAWLSPNGSLRLIERRGEPLASDGRGLPTDGTWDDAPAAADETLPAGSNDADLVQELPADPDGIRDELLQRGCDDRQRGLTRSFCLQQQIVDLHRTYVIPPKILSAMWRMLADEEGFRLLGKVKDRADREGTGVSLISNQAPNYRNVLIISPTTGELLGSEEILIKTLPKFDLKAPAITSFTAFLESGYSGSDR